jgi:NADH:ubiquinone oxidoreductase subunit
VAFGGVAAGWTVGAGAGMVAAEAGRGAIGVLRWLQFNRLGTHLLTRRRGEKVGEDEAGNAYYRERGARDWRTERRWVVFPDTVEPEASQVPPGWNAWLAHNLEQPPSRQPLPTKPWEKPHRPNLTGTAEAYVPPGHELRGARREPATGDYEPWRP